MGITEAGGAGGALRIEIWGIQGEFLFQHIPYASVGSHFASLSLSWVSVNTYNSLTEGCSKKKYIRVREMLKGKLPKSL